MSPIRANLERKFSQPHIPRESDRLLRDPKHQFTRLQKIAVDDVHEFGQRFVVYICPRDVLVGIENSQLTL